MSFALLALASRLLTSSLHHSLPPLRQGIEHVALPMLFARFELARTWLYIATNTQRTQCVLPSVTSTVFGSSGAYFCMFTEVPTNFVEELQLDDLRLASATPLAHRSFFTVMSLRNLDVLCHLIDLLWPLVVLDGINQSAFHSASS